jgi:hypothetical protein
VLIVIAIPPSQNVKNTEVNTVSGEFPCKDNKLKLKYKKRYLHGEKETEDEGTPHVPVSELGAFGLFSGDDYEVEFVEDHLEVALEGVPDGFVEGVDLFVLVVFDVLVGFLLELSYIVKHFIFEFVVFISYFI